MHPAVDVKSLHAKIGELTLEKIIPKKRQHQLLARGAGEQTESLGTPMQIVDYSRAVACFVGRGPGVDVLHSVTHGVVEEGPRACGPWRLQP